MNRFPKTIGIIMDGNRRWAKNRNLPIISGHRAGVKSLKKIVVRCCEIGVKELNIFAFSTENWNRDPFEISGIMNLIEWYLKSEIAELNKQNICFKSIGNKHNVKNGIRNLLKRAEKITFNNTGLKLSVALGYGGKQDIVFSTKKIVDKIIRGELYKEEITEKTVQQNLQSSHISNIDLLIRTSGEQRISNFLLWQVAYSEIYISEKLWPDFNPLDLDYAISSYLSRERRFGTSNIINNDI